MFLYAVKLQFIVLILVSSVLPRQCFVLYDVHLMFSIYLNLWKSYMCRLHLLYI